MGTINLANQGSAIGPTGETRKPPMPKDRLRRTAAMPCRRSGEQVPRPPQMHGRALRAFRLAGHEKPCGITKTAALRPSRKVGINHSKRCAGVSCHFVSGNARFVSGKAEIPMGRGNGAALRGGLPTGAWAGFAARRRSRHPPMTVFVFRAERSIADKSWSHSSAQSA